MRFKNKKAVEIAINTIIYMIIGIIIFGLGISIFTKFFGFADDEVVKINKDLIKNLNKLKCGDSDQVICAPTYKIKLSKRSTFSIIISNLENEDEDFILSINPLGENNNITNECGEVRIYYYTESLNIKAGTSTSIPLIIDSMRVKNKDCSFTSIISTSNGYKSPLIINID